MSDPTKGIGAFEEGHQLADPKGVNYLLAIAVDQYHHLPKLFNPVRDARTFIELMIERYRFDESNVVTIFDEEATEPRIFAAFRQLVERITPDDNLIVYYSGHGEFDPVLDEGYWIPVNAHEGALNEYIANDTIRRFISRINSQHTFLISDACFAGSLFASGSKNVSKRYERDPSRWGLTAGRKEIVSDGKPGMHSPFADALLYRLRTSSEPLGVQELCAYVVEHVEANAFQSPIGEPLKVDGHKNGQFVFHLKKDEGRDWAAAMASDTAEDYQRFLTMYPAGVHAEEALWQLAQKTDDISSHVAYLDAFPRGAYQRPAEKRLAQLEDERDWQETRRINTILAYRKYKQSHPKGTYLQQADDHIQALLGGSQSAPPPPKPQPLAAQPKSAPPVSAKPAASGSFLSKKTNQLILGAGLAIVAIILAVWAFSGGKQQGWDCSRHFTNCLPFESEKGAYYLVQKYGVWGVATEDGKVLVEPQYNELHHFTENGLALARRGTKFGWIDFSGREVIEFAFDEATDFENGEARVVANGKEYFLFSHEDGSLEMPEIGVVAPDSEPEVEKPESPPGGEVPSPPSEIAVDDRAVGQLAKLSLALAGDWDKLRKEADYTSGNCATYIPEYGIRGRYIAAKRHLSLGMLERLTREPVFASGPHSGGEFNCSSQSDFGHYNPAFLEKLTVMIEKLLQNEEIVRQLRPLYEKEFRQYLRIYMEAYKPFAGNQELAREYVRMVRAGNASAYGTPRAQEFAKEMERKGLFWYDAYVVAHFWIRRTADGTHEQFYRMLVLVMKTFE
jgi:hypothetical protein